MIKYILVSAAILAASVSHASVLSIDQHLPADITDAGGWGGNNNQGQSFQPSDAGAFPNSAYLTEFSFITSGQTSNLSATPTYLSIYTGNGSVYVGSSTNTQLWSTTLTELSWTFDDLELNPTASYQAFFSTGAGAGNLITQPLVYSASNPYAHGDLWNGGPYGGLDAYFTATFNTQISVVPEPSSYALFAGLAGLGFCVVRRFRRG